MKRRRALAEPLNATNTKEWEQPIRDIVTGHLDKIVTRGHADLIQDLLRDFPATVALKFLGVPETDITEAKKYAVGQIMFGFGRPSENDQIAGCDGMGRYYNFAKDLVERLKQTPDAPGWVPFAIRVSQEQPDLIDDRFLYSMMMSGMSAAHETTSNASANSVLALLRNRSAWDEICADPGRIPNAVEESLRYASSVVAWRRLCVKPTTIGGVDIPEGAKMLIVTASASYDDEMFDEPERFDIDRANAKQHLAFGFGNHTCLDAPLARLEMKVLLEELVKRLPHMKLVDQEFDYLPNTSFRGPQSLRVEWDPSTNPLTADRRPPLTVVPASRQPLKESLTDARINTDTRRHRGRDRGRPRSRCPRTPDGRRRRRGSHPLPARRRITTRVAARRSHRSRPGRRPHPPVLAVRRSGRPGLVAGGHPARSDRSRRVGMGA
ncbi:cytochrome P450 [Gordonia terrae]